MLMRLWRELTRSNKKTVSLQNTTAAENEQRLRKAWQAAFEVVDADMMLADLYALAEFESPSPANEADGNFREGKRAVVMAIVRRLESTRYDLMREEMR